MSFEHIQPILIPGVQRVCVIRPFPILFAVGTAWLESHGVSHAEIPAAAKFARVVAFPKGKNECGAGPCKFGCAAERRAGEKVPMAMGWVSRMPEFDQAEFPGVALFLFDRCRSFCTSSRLHFGGKLAFEITIGGQTVRSAKMDLCARPIKSDPPFEEAKTACFAQLRASLAPISSIRSTPPLHLSNDAPGESIRGECVWGLSGPKDAAQEYMEKLFKEISGKLSGLSFVRWEITEIPFGGCLIVCTYGFTSRAFALASVMVAIQAFFSNPPVGTAQVFDISFV